MSDLEDSNADDFDLRIWMSLVGISDAGVKKIELAQVCDLKTLLLFKDGDVEALKLAIGDALRFKDGIARLHQLHDKIPEL